MSNPGTTQIDLGWGAALSRLHGSRHSSISWLRGGFKVPELRTVGSSHGCKLVLFQRPARKADGGANVLAMHGRQNLMLQIMHIITGLRRGGSPEGCACAVFWFSATTVGILSMSSWPCVIKGHFPGPCCGCPGIRSHETRHVWRPQCVRGMTHLVQLIRAGSDRRLPTVVPLVGSPGAGLQLDWFGVAAGLFGGA